MNPEAGKPEEAKTTSALETKTDLETKTNYSLAVKHFANSLLLR
jgi:hypothetical protein